MGLSTVSPDGRALSGGCGGCASSSVAPCRRSWGGGRGREGQSFLTCPEPTDALRAGVKFPEPSQEAFPELTGLICKLMWPHLAQNGRVGSGLADLVGRGGWG